ncbi:helix-turn-helix domain-containing protein [Erythrobacter arachoides]|uniref:Helix-turn-helix domain-containing protein n=1 Tax=Aurantiacibacter arachoides TaxID=1850444 RepID=A0A845A3X1_9SPHN|nr:helix-turn-helix domain-containing protein [Aurantiacibacter arachoides]
MNFCQACSVRNRAICADLEDDEIALLNKIGRRRNLEAGESLLWAGDEAVLVANVVSGVLKLSTQTSDGREQILGLAYPSDFLGRPFSDTTPYNAEALSDSVVCVFRRPDFERFALEHSKLEHKLLERTLSELDRTRRWILLLGRMNAEERLATLLLEIGARSVAATCRNSIRTDPDRFELPMSRQQIADILGLTIETVSRQFTKMREDGVIKVSERRNITICKRDVLENLAA